MGYITAIAIVLILFMLMHYFTELTHTQKITITATLLGFILFAWGYNLYKAKEREKMYDIVIKYKQGKTIHCGKYDVNATNFSLSTGTYTFIGKEKTPYYAVMISAYDCE